MNLNLFQFDVDLVVLTVSSESMDRKSGSIIPLKYLISVLISTEAKALLHSAWTRTQDMMGIKTSANDTVQSNAGLIFCVVCVQL